MQTEKEKTLTSAANNQNETYENKFAKQTSLPRIQYLSVSSKKYIYKKEKGQRVKVSWFQRSEYMQWVLLCWLRSKLHHSS